MKCPLFVMARLEAGAPHDTKLIYCLKEECAWWDKTSEKCAVVSIIPEIVVIAKCLEKLVDKMPHEEQFRR